MGADKWIVCREGLFAPVEKLQVFFYLSEREFSRRKNQWSMLDLSLKSNEPMSVAHRT